MFDQLVLLAKGKMVYSGELSKCHAYLERIGHPCPPGFNLADYLSMSMVVGGVDSLLIIST